MHLSLGLPSHLSSFLLFLINNNNNNKKQQEQVTKKFSERKQAHVGMEPSKPAKQDGNNTTTLSHHPYILCHFANYAHHKTTCTLAYSHPLNNQTRHSPLLTPQPSAYKISAMFSSNKISQHNLHSNMPYRLSTACGLHSFCIQDRLYLPCSVAIALQPPKIQLTLHAHQHGIALNMLSI